MSIYFIAFDSTGLLNCPSKKQQLLGQGSLTGIRVADNPKSTSARYFFFKAHFSKIIGKGSKIGHDLVTGNLP
jgi:hypothetical protein